MGRDNLEVTSLVTPKLSACRQLSTSARVRFATRTMLMKSNLWWPVVGLLLSACASAGTESVSDDSEARATDAALEAPADHDAGPRAPTPVNDASMALPTLPDAARVMTFPIGEGVTNPVERSTPCAASEVGMFRNAPEDHDTIQACLPNYQVWAAVECGGPLPPCTCDVSRCDAGEVPKLISDMFCVCLSPCSSQMSGATCGPSAQRKCIPVDDVTMKQVFICGGA